MSDYLRFKYLSHSGKGHDDNPPGRGSGRYPYGSGKKPYQRSGEHKNVKNERQINNGKSDNKDYKKLLVPHSDYSTKISVYDENDNYIGYPISKRMDSKESKEFLKKNENEIKSIFWYWSDGLQIGNIDNQNRRINNLDKPINNYLYSSNNLRYIDERNGSGNRFVMLETPIEEEHGITLMVDKKTKKIKEWSISSSYL